MKDFLAGSALLGLPAVLIVFSNMCARLINFLPIEALPVVYMALLISAGLIITKHIQPKLSASFCLSPIVFSLIYTHACVLAFYVTDYCALRDIFDLIVVCVLLAALFYLKNQLFLWAIVVFYVSNLFFVGMALVVLVPLLPNYRNFINAIPFNMVQGTISVLLIIRLSRQSEKLLAPANRLKEVPKETIPCLLSATAFIFLILQFAFVYYVAALRTEGDNFIFNKDAIISQNVSALREKFPYMHPSVYERIAKDIYEHPESIRAEFEDASIGERVYSISEHIIEDGVYKESKSRLGEGWAHYYVERFKFEGATHFRLVKHPRVPAGKNTDYYNLFLYKVDKKGMSKEQVENMSMRPSNYDAKKHGEAYARYLVTYSPEKMPIGRIVEEHLEPILYLYVFLLPATNYLDGTPWDLKEQIKSKYLTSFLDYLYFSATTLTGGGYGDIMPRTRIMRVYVMIEYLIGWMLGGIFLSSIGYLIYKRTEKQEF